jgi:hypothetical protein
MRNRKHSAALEQRRSVLAARTFVALLLLVRNLSHADQCAPHHLSGYDHLLNPEFIGLCWSSEADFGPKSMSRSKAFHPLCSQLEERVVLSDAMPRMTVSTAVVQVAQPRSTLLTFKGNVPYAMLEHHGEPAGSPISTMSLSPAEKETLTVNGTKVPWNHVYDPIRQVAGPTVAYLGATGFPQFYGPATLTLTLHKGVVTLDLTPVTPGSSTMDFTVVSGTASYGAAHGTGTITFGKGATFHSNR